MIVDERMVTFINSLDTENTAILEQIEQEALDTSLEIARTMQPLFESWDDLMSSYMRGYEYWAEESADERRALYEDLKTRQDNPYSVDFKMQLEKTW